MDAKSKETSAPRVLLVSGMAGAGRSLVLRTLEDLGYEAIDNMPLPFVEKILFEEDNVYAPDGNKPLALNIDLRARNFSTESVCAILRTLQKKKIGYAFLFLESDADVIAARYRSTRRHHPLGNGHTLQESIQKEKQMLEPLKAKAHHVIDTSLLTPIELAGRIRRLFGFHAQRTVHFEVISFAFIGGLPREANMVFDMRFLKNPHYDPSLQKLTGRDADVQDFLLRQPLFLRFKDQLLTMVRMVLPCVEEEGRGMFVLAFGCSGGRHRSVTMAEIIHAWMVNHGYNARLQHRELE